MASKLILDKSDPGVAEMVKAWEDGKSYKAEITFTQDATSANTTDNTVTAIVDLSEDVGESPTEPAAEESSEAPAVPEKKMPKGGLVPEMK